MKCLHDDTTTQFAELLDDTVTDDVITEVEE